MTNNPKDRLKLGVLEAMWAFGPSPLLRPCDGCGEPVEIGETCYRPVGFFGGKDAPRLTARELGIKDTFCVDCGVERQDFLAQMLGKNKSA